MDTAAAILAWTYQTLAIWYGAAIVSGLLIFAAERLSRRREPSASDVQRAAERYRQFYGAAALVVIGDHMLAASFAPDRRHLRFLRRVLEEMLTNAVSASDRANAVEHEIPEMRDPRPRRVPRSSCEMREQ